MASPDQNLVALFGHNAAHLGAHSHDCNYLSGLTATDEAWLCGVLDPLAYHHLMDRGFRRSGHILYRPVCDDCRKCVPIRVPAAEFVPSKSQRRVLRRNADVKVRVGPPILTPEKHAVYRRYLQGQHQGSPQSEDMESLREFLFSSCVQSVEFEYRDGEGLLLGVSIADLCQYSLSSVYHFFDPQHARRSIGVFSALYEIQWCAQRRVPHYYLGYWVEGCRAMEYKNNYQPCELLIDGEWITATA